MSPNQYRALELVVTAFDDRGPARPGGATDRQARTVHRDTVAALERRGLIRRELYETDLAVVLLPTDAGRELLARNPEPWELPR